MARALEATAPEGRSGGMIVAAVVFAALAAILLFVALQSRGGGGGSSSAVADTSVVVAKQDIAVNTRLTAEMLEVRSVPSDEARIGVYASTQGLIGLPARYPIQSGDQITASKIGVEAIRDEKDIALVLSKGMRAVGVKATEINAVGGLLLPGNHVDIIAVFGQETGGIDKAVTVLQNVEVLGVAQEAQEPVPAASDGTEGDAAAISGQRPDGVERQPSARSVTLAVTPDQAQLLAALQAQADVQIFLSLRSVDDTDVPALNETNLLPFHSPPIQTPQ